MRVMKIEFMKQRFQHLGLILSIDAQKNLVGGLMQYSFNDEGSCPGSCETDKECASVNKGKCSITCDDKKQSVVMRFK